VISVVAIAIGSVVGWLLYDAVIDLLLDPYCDYWSTVPPGNRPTENCSLFFMGAVDPVLIKLKVVVFIGLFVALPVVLWELWSFIVPGLTRREKRLAVPFVASSVILFALGAYLAYATLPRALSFLLGFAGTEFAPLLTGDRFLSFVMLVALAFGLSFEFPIALVFLQLAGVVSPGAPGLAPRAILALDLRGVHHPERRSVHHARDDAADDGVLRGGYHRGSTPEEVTGTGWRSRARANRRAVRSRSRAGRGRRTCPSARRSCSGAACGTRCSPPSWSRPRWASGTGSRSSARRTASATSRHRSVER
jgi:Tat protein translocase TatC